MSLIYTFWVIIVSDGNHNYDYSYVINSMTPVIFLSKLMVFD